MVIIVNSPFKGSKEFINSGIKVSPNSKYNSEKFVFRSCRLLFGNNCSCNSVARAIWSASFFFCAFSIANINAQDFSNKGKEFWVVFPPHQPSGTTSLADLSLYISSDKNTSGHIVINGDSISFNIIAFTPQEFILPRNTTYVSGLESATDDPTLIQKIVMPVSLFDL